MLPRCLVRRSGFRPAERRDMSVTGGTTTQYGGALVPTEKVGLADDFYNASVLRQNGAMVLEGLVGNLDLPRYTKGTDPTKKAENANSDELSPTVTKLALTPLFVLWFGFGMTSTVVITALICFFPLMENTLTALQQVPPERLELFRMLGATRAQTLWRLKVPMGLPAILAGLRVAVVLALVGAVVGEFIGASRGLGALVIASQGTMDTALMFAVLVLIAALGLLVYEAALFVERRLLLPFHRNS